MTSRGGCLKDVLAGVGCLTLLGLLALAGWRYRAQVAGLYRSVVHGSPPPVAPPSPEPGAPAGTGGPRALEPGARSPAKNDPAGRSGAARPPSAPAPSGPLGAPSDRGGPSAAALASAERKRQALERPDGPSFVVLDASEVASLIVEGLDPAARRALDSVEVILGHDRLSLRAAVKTAVLGGLLGPVTALLKPQEPMRVSGPARVAGVGAVAFEPDSFMVRAFPFPSQAVAGLVNRMTGRSDGIVPFRVPATVGDLRIRPDGVTFYRRAARSREEHGA